MWRIGSCEVSWWLIIPKGVIVPKKKKEIKNIFKKKQIKEGWKYKIEILLDVRNSLEGKAGC